MFTLDNAKLWAGCGRTRAQWSSPCTRCSRRSRKPVGRAMLIFQRISNKMTAAPDYQCRSFATASCSLCSRSSPFYPRYHLNGKVNDKSAQSGGGLTCSSKNIVLPGTPGHCLDGRLVSCDRVHRRLPGLNSDISHMDNWPNYLSLLSQVTNLPVPELNTIVIASAC